MVCSLDGAGSPGAADSDCSSMINEEQSPGAPAWKTALVKLLYRPAERWLACRRCTGAALAPRRFLRATESSLLLPREEWKNCTLGCTCGSCSPLPFLLQRRRGVCIVSARLTRTRPVRSVPLSLSSGRELELHGILADARNAGISSLEESLELQLSAQASEREAEQSSNPSSSIYCLLWASVSVWDPTATYSETRVQVQVADVGDDLVRRQQGVGEEKEPTQGVYQGSHQGSSSKQKDGNSYRSFFEGCPPGALTPWHFWPAVPGDAGGPVRAFRQRAAHAGDGRPGYVEGHQQHLL